MPDVSLPRNDGSHVGGRGRAGGYVRIVIWLCLAVVVGFSLDSARQTWVSRSDASGNSASVVRTMGLVQTGSKRLAPQFIDAKGRLLADPPTAPGQFIDPPTLIVAHIDSTDAENPGLSWLDFEKHLSTATGKPVTDMVYRNDDESLKQIKDEKLTLVALHAADTPFLVNNFGFQPTAVLGADGVPNGNHLDIIVPASSPISSLDAVRDHKLVCTVPSSITGYRAAVAALAQKAGLRPNVDYQIVWSLGQKRSILGISKKEFEAAAVSDDKLKSLEEEGKIAASDYRIIYRSDVIPRTTIGWFYNLKPEVASTVRDAILSYRPNSPTTRPASGDEGRTLHFFPIEYKNDFAAVRQIDDRFDPRFDAKSKSAKSQAPSTAPN